MASSNSDRPTESSSSRARPSSSPSTLSGLQKSNELPRLRCSAMRTFSSTVRCGNTAEIWNERISPRRDITGSGPAAIARLGLIRSFQISAVFPHLTVLENVRIALQRKRGNSVDFWRPDRVLGELDGRARELLDSVGLSEFEDAIAVELPYGRKRALEIATTLALEPEMLLLDEPTAGMTHEDVERTAALIKRVAADRTVLMVEHNLSVVAKLSDRITVLSRGEIIAEGNYDSGAKHPEVNQAYLGSEHA